jgi:tetratricopeptide (TPR) repeat protein
MRLIVLFIWFMLFPAQSAVGKDLNDADKAKALNRQVDLLIGQLSTATDSSFAISTSMDIVKTTVLCDFYDSKPNKKGEVKPKFRQENIKRVAPIRAHVVDGGMYYYNLRRNEDALQVLELYIETADSPLFLNTNQDLGLVTYYASLLSFGMKKYKKAEHYADVALKDNNYAKDAAEIKINCMKHQLTNKKDSAEYIIALLELHDMAPENSSYFTMLMEYYTSSGQEKELGQFVNNELKKDSTNKQLWVLKGETEMKTRLWDDAISSYGKAVAIDSVYIPAIYNIGICYLSKALEMKGNLDSSGEKGTSRKAARMKVREVFSQSQPYLEKAKELDPDMKIVSWAAPLYQVYFVLGEKEKANEVKLILDNSKLLKK